MTLWIKVANVRVSKSEPAEIGPTFEEMSFTGKDF